MVGVTDVLSKWSEPDNTGKKLEGTSQGRAKDLPPDHFIDEELVKFSVIGIKNVRPSDLTGTPHDIFARKRWPKLNDKRFEAIAQSILLATNLLEAGMPYFASWLPSRTFRDGWEQKPHTGRRQWHSGKMSIVTLKEDPTEEEVKTVRDELNEILEGVEWREDPNMFIKQGRWGYTSSEYPRPERCRMGDFIDSINDWDANCKEAGFKRRQNTVFLTSHYIDVLLDSKRDSEQHLIAAFHLAVTMIHELAHVVYWQDFNSWTPEPLVNDDCLSELGLAFTSRLFGGWLPDPIIEDPTTFAKSMGFGSGRSKRKEPKFTRGMMWSKQLSRPLRRQSWTMSYSMPFEFVQRIMTQLTWDSLKRDPFQLSEIQKTFQPETPFRNGTHARRAVCNRFQRNFSSEWAWKPTYLLQRQFDEGMPGGPQPSPPRDEEEDFGPTGNPIPYFGFLDLDWTTDESKTTEIQNASPSTLTTVTYSGIYDEATTKILQCLSPPKRPRSNGDEDDNEGHARKKAKQSDYRDWPEGVLRRECSQRDVSTFGGRGDLIARLEAFNTTIAESHQTGKGKEPEKPGEAALASTISLEDQNIYRFDFNLFETTIPLLKARIYTLTNIPPNLQRLLLGGPKGYLLGGGPLQGNSDGGKILAEFGSKGWDKVILYRVQRTQKPDPGPLPHTTSSDSDVANDPSGPGSNSDAATIKALKAEKADLEEDLKEYINHVTKLMNGNEELQRQNDELRRLAGHQLPATASKQQTKLQQAPAQASKSPTKSKAPPKKISHTKSKDQKHFPEKPSAPRGTSSKSFKGKWSSS